MKRYKLKELISNTYIIVSKDVIDFLNIHNTKRIGDTKIYLINSCQYEIVDVVEEIKENKMSHSERRLKGYRKRKLTFLKNRCSIKIDPCTRLVYVYDPFTKKSKLGKL